MSARKISDSQVKKMMDYLNSPSTRNVTRRINPNRTGAWAPKWKVKKEEEAMRDELIEAIMWAVVESEGKEEKIKAMKKQHDEFKKAKADFEKHSKKDDD